MIRISPSQKRNPLFCATKVLHGLYRSEINIKPWESLLKELREGNKRSKWIKREPYAYWKGNPAVAETRRDLLKCNVSDKQDWNARLYAQVIMNSVILGLRSHGTCY